MRIYLDNSNIFANFGAWIGGSCKPSDKEKLTLFPRFTFCQQNLINVSNMLRFEELPEVNSERWLSLEDLPGEEYKKRTINRIDNSKINIYKENKLVFSSTIIHHAAEFLKIKKQPFLKLLHGRTKRCRRIREYTITVEKPDGVKYLIKDGMIDHG